MNTFYENLKPFARFDEITDAQHFRPVPEDWMVILTDVKDSTKAIEDGRYKDVNTIGVAGIVSVSNALNGHEFPYVFGGDGATMLLPLSDLKKISANLLALVEMSRENFGLELRVGMVPVSEITAAGKSIDVARFAIECGMSVAVIRGGGLSLAEEKIKGNPEAYALKSNGSGKVDLKGLSCRWKEIPSKKGSIVSLLVVARGENHDASYREVLAKLRHLVGGDLEDTNPVHPAQMRFHTAKENIDNEAKFHRSRRSSSWIARLFEILISALAFRKGIKPLLFDAEGYQRSMRTHSDYRKFDDMLRMIIDCTEAQTAEIRILLEDFRAAGRLYYGLFEADASLMTCFVSSVKNEGHIHFIDGANGGYALAAKELKSQMAF